MEKELDLTLRLGLPNPTVETQLRLNTCNTTDQGTNINNGYGANINNGYGANNNKGEVFNLRRTNWGDDEVMINEGATNNNVDVNARVYNSLFYQFPGAFNTLIFCPYPMPPTQAPPAPEAPPASSDHHVLIDVPARRAHRNNILRRMDAFFGRNTERTKQCSNGKCNAVTTPQWRRGPLGRKTLCNACGIKFRREEERKAKRDAVINQDN